MSADKPIQRYDNYYYEMDERAEGEYVAYSDHLAAIREARAEAFEEAAKIADGYCWSACDDNASFIQKARNSEDDADEIAKELRDIAVKERLQ